VWYPGKMKYRALALALLAAAPLAIGVSPSAPLEGPRSAEASVAVLISLEDLTAASTYVVIATAGEQRSTWEETPSGKRIVTYTRMKVDRSVAGPAETELWVRTLGGVVDKIGQSVSGEAQIATGARSMLFLAKVDVGLVVAGMAQGHYPIVDDATAPSVKPQRLAGSPDAGMLLPRRGPTISARERLVGLSVDEAVLAVQRARKATDAK
jgi:hypothetical protein